MNNKPDLHKMVKGCVEHNRISQKDLFTNFYGYAAAICNRYISNENDLVEVINDGFLKVFKSIGNFDNSKNDIEGTLRGWIKSIMIHTSIDFYRKHKNTTANYILDTEINAEISENNGDSIIAKLNYQEIITLVNQLSPSNKLIFNLYIIDGLKHEEIATLLGITIGSSKSGLFKARQHLIKLIKNKHLV